MPLLLLLLTLLGGALPAQEPGGGDEIVRLRDGRMLIGEIVAHDLDGLVVLSARSGGRFRLDWTQLFPGEEERLKRSMGYQVGAVTPMVGADRLLLVDGSQRVGRILRRDERGIEIRIRDTALVVPLQRLAAPPEKVTVPAAQVLTPEQFYNERLLEIDAASGLAQYEFARELQAVFALEQALEHMRKAGELAAASGDQALLRRVGGAEQELQLSLANRSQAEMLEEVRRLIHRERFTAALETMQQFGEQYPDSPLRGEYLDLQDRFAEQRQTSMERHLVRNWFNTVVKIVKRKALDRESPVDSMLSWAETELPTLVREEMFAELQEMKADVAPADVDAMWAKRLDHSPQRFQASFGDGSWILGEDRARAGLDKKESETEDGRTKAEKEFQDRIKRYLENVNRAQGGGRDGGGVEPEDWWRRSTPVERFQFLLAYYGEFSGDYTVTSVRFDACPTCGGTGVVTIMNIGAQGARDSKINCPRCHHVGIRRAITFR